MQALILAAGCGSRLDPRGKGVPKCLLEIGGRTLLEHQLNVLKQLGVRQVCVVVGHRSEQVTPVLARKGCNWRTNERFAETNSLYSLSLALDWLRDDFLLCNCDVLADPRIYRSLVNNGKCALAFDSTSGRDAEHMKVSFRGDGTLRRIGKELADSVTGGENVGLVKFSAASIRSVHKQVSQALAEDGEHQWAPAAINRLAQCQRIMGMDIRDLPWVEIDFKQDLDYARSTIWPRICRFDGLVRLGRWPLWESPARRLGSQISDETANVR